MALVRSLRLLEVGATNADAVPSSARAARAVRMAGMLQVAVASELDPLTTSTAMRLTLQLSGPSA